MGYLSLSGLSRFLGKVEEKLAGKLDKVQGSGNAGRLVIVGSNGNLTLLTPHYISSPQSLLAECWIDDENSSESAFEIAWSGSAGVIADGTLYGAQVILYTDERTIHSSLSLCGFVDEPENDSKELYFHSVVFINGSGIEMLWQVNMTAMRASVWMARNGQTVTPSSLFADSDLSEMALMMYRLA